MSKQLGELLNYKQAEYKRFTDTDLASCWLQPHIQKPFKDNSRKILRAATIELYLRRVFRKE
jgi:hypothetical protein